MNDYQSVSTTDIPAPVPPVGKPEIDKEIEAVVKSDKSGETAEINAQDAVIEESDADTEADDMDVDAGEDDQKTDEEKAKPKKKGGFQKKLEKQAREIELLREQVARQQQPPSAEKPVEKSVANSDDPEPKDANYDSLTDFYTDHSRWAARQELSAYEKRQESKAREAAQRAEFESTVQSFQAKVSDFKKESGDFDEVITEVDDVRLNFNLQEAITTSDLGPKLMYELAKNRTVLEKIASLPISKALLELGKFEASISKSEAKPEVKTKTTAPQPIKPVGTKSPGRVVKDLQEITDFDEYKAVRFKK